MKKDKVLWADDEIDLLKPHMMFLQEKGYEVTPVVSGQDAIDCCREQSFDIIFLDENMPGLTGLETLSQIKEMEYGQDLDGYRAILNYGVAFYRKNVKFLSFKYKRGSINIKNISYRYRNKSKST